MRDSGTTDSGYVAARASLDPGGATRVAARMNAQPIGTKCRIPVVIESALMELAVVVGKLAKPVPNLVRHSQNVRYLVRRERALDRQHVLAEQVLLRGGTCGRANHHKESPVRHHPS